MPRDKTRASRLTAVAGAALIARPRVEDMSEPPVHPGEVLLEEFLSPLGLTQTAFAARLHIPLQRLNDLIRARRGVTPDTALRLARALGTSAELWLNLQEAWDLWQASHSSAVEDIAEIEPLPRDRSGALRATA
jgi:addiction module HigA family antidote